MAFHGRQNRSQQRLAYWSRATRGVRRALSAAGVDRRAWIGGRSGGYERAGREAGAVPTTLLRLL